MTLNFHFLPFHFHHALTRTPLICPNLTTLKLAGLDSKMLKGLIKARNRGPTAIQQLILDRDDDLPEHTVRWLTKQVKSVKFYEASGEEDEDEEDEDVDESSQEDEG